MNIALRRSWTQDEFFAWAGHAEGRYEFDGEQPVAMTGGTLNHAAIMRNLHRALDVRLRGTRCRSFGPDAGVATVGSAIRYPDALITCSDFIGTSRTTPGVTAVFEILSPTSGRTDRVVKVREYGEVDSIRCYVILESTGVGVMALQRQAAGQAWSAAAMTGRDELLGISELGLEIPLSEFYEDVDFGPDQE